MSDHAQALMLSTKVCLIHSNILLDAHLKFVCEGTRDFWVYSDARRCDPHHRSLFHRAEVHF